MTDRDDGALLTRIANKEEKAMEIFYQQFSSMVYHFAMKTVNNGADAAEVTNEVMMEVWRKASAYNGKSKVSTWLLSITHHKAVDAVRRKVRHQADELEPETYEQNQGQEAGLQCSLEAARAGVEDSEQVQRCMNQLKGGHRQVVYLTFFSGLAYPDIAGILEIPPGTVKTRMLYAKKQLMACLSRLRENLIPV